ncbi:MAG: primosomal protein N' [Elusimicrobiota bacterium]|jgi:primosomal protein N' (replication factor Y)
MPPARFIEVVFPLPLNRAFHYRVPANGPADPGLGARVLAPFGKKKNLVGYVIGKTNETPPFPTKEILTCLDPEPFIDETLIELARWLSERYLCSLGEALACLVPPHLSPPKRPPRESAADSMPGRPAGRPSDAFHLSAEQQHALNTLEAAVDSKQFHPFLLRGITDSGKTEIYVRTIERALKQGRQAIFLLPEIALTPPFIEKLQARFPGQGVALWHSGITASERYRIWCGVRQGVVHVLLGARSAVFAPFPKLGVIVMDEEHEPTYKQEDRPRYHTREVALERARRTQSVLIMGSATPSLESYWSAKQGVYQLLELTSRVEERSLPPVTLIDRRTAPVEPGKSRPRRGTLDFSIFSEPLKLAIEQRLAKREQVMLFVNRRGYTPFLRCSVCGWVARCPRCSTTLALHIKDEKLQVASSKLDDGLETRNLKQRTIVPADGFLQCHSCWHKEAVPIQCASCKGLRLRHYGIGTQRVEQELRKLFPFVKVSRLDRDIASSRHAYERIYQNFAKGEVDVLVGTQMIAKGFDFQNVTLVGVVDADVSLHLPDFRSAERTFQLIAQVAGRTGRGEAGGKVLVQTHHPDHYALQAARAHDYLTFYEQEIKHRELLRYPPFCRLIHILIRGTKEPVVLKMAENLYEKLEAIRNPFVGDKASSPSVSVGDPSCYSTTCLDSPPATAGNDERRVQIDILGPAPAPYSRLRNQFRYQILLKGTDEAFAPYVGFLRAYRSPKAFVSVDIDPADLL